MPKGKRGFQKGHKINIGNSWNKGKKFSKERREKIGNANKISRLGMIFSKKHKNNLSKALKGRIIPDGVRKKMSKTHKRIGSGERLPHETGKKATRWEGGVSFEPYSSEFNNKLKEMIRRRDGYKCQLCGVPQIECMRKLDVHHIDYNKKNCAPNNLIALCKKCNSKVNSNRNYWMYKFQKKERRKKKNG